MIPEPRRCSTCGTELPASAPMGLCVPCLLGIGLDTKSGGDTDAGAETGVRFGEYELLDAGKEGGMGVVYRARQPGLNRTVALKVVRTGRFTSPQAVQRFRAEAEAAASLDHPHIVPIHEVGERNGRHFFTMKWIEGGSLDDALRRPSPLSGERAGVRGQHVVPPRRAAELLSAVARAVHHAHQRGIIHRDLKPSNILIDKDGQPYVSDFGLAKRLSDPEHEIQYTELTQSGDIFGTPTYMAPEQAAGKAKDVTTAVDVYALGAILYQLLCGRPPFVGDTPLETLRKVMDEPPKRPSAMLRRVDRDLETICLKCLEKDPRDRYASAAALADDLHRWLRHEPILVRPSGVWSRAQKWAKRKPAIAALAISLVLSAAAGVIITVVKQRENDYARRQADVAREEAQKNLARAKDSEAEARTVLNFVLEHVLAAGRPKGQPGGLGHDVSLRAAVEAAEAGIAIAFSNKPVVEAAIRDTLALTYRYLGEYTNAIGQYQRALALRKLHLGAENAYTLTTMNNLAVAFMRGGWPDKALALGEETLSLRKSTLGPDHPETLSSMNTLANAYHDVRGPAAALPLYQETLKLRRAKLGDDHPETLTSINNLASAQKDLGNLDKAIQLYEAALKSLRIKSGPDHPNTLSTMNNLGLAYRAAKRFESAIPLLGETLKLTKAKFPPDHPDTMNSINNLALCYQDAGQPDRALVLFDELLPLATANLASGHPEVFYSVEHVANAYFRANRLSDAESVLKVLLAAQRKTLPADNGAVAATLDFLGNCLLRQKKHADAVPVLEDCLAIRQRRQPEDWATFKAKARLGAAFLGQEDYAKAEPLLVQGFEGMKQRQSTIPSNSRARYVQEAGNNVVSLYIAWDKPDKAAEWRQKLAEFNEPTE